MGTRRSPGARATCSPISASPTPRNARRSCGSPIARGRLTQAVAAEKLGINQPKVSALANYKLDGFSVERLMTFLTALDRDVEIVIRRKPRSRAVARISVVAA